MTNLFYTGSQKFRPAPEIRKEPSRLLLLQKKWPVHRRPPLQSRVSP